MMLRFARGRLRDGDWIVANGGQQGELDELTKAQGIPWRLADGYESHGEGCKLCGIPCFDQNIDHQEKIHVMERIFFM